MKRRPIYYDTETTGIRATTDRIVEIAAYDPERGLTFEKLINPGIPIPSEASAIHHISNEMVADSPSFAQIGQEFIDFCEGDVVLIAHNNDAFDFHFVQNELNRHSLTLPTHWKFVDSLKWARRYRPDLPRHTLQFLREMYGVAVNNAHRALDDVIVLHQVFSSMIDDLSIDEALSILQRPRDLQHMPFGKYQGKPLKEVPADYLKWLAGSGAFDKPENNELCLSLKKFGLMPV